MAVFRDAIIRYSVSLLKFPFSCSIQVFTCEILLICWPKYQYSRFSIHFSFLILLYFWAFFYIVGDVTSRLNQSFSNLFFSLRIYVLINSHCL